MGFSSLGAAIPQLANLTSRAPGATLATQYGGQNFTHCCLVAMNQSLNVHGPNSSLAFNNPAYFLSSLTIPDLEQAVSVDAGLFPCGASWNGNWAGAPVVRVPYNWCLDQCGGWEISTFDVLSQWVGPLVQFILPSLAFCLNVPRVSKIAIPSGIFQGHPRSVQGIFTYWIRLLWAIFLMLIDTFVWLSMCFAFAGPMLLSAVYEYMLDRKVLEFLDPPKEKQKKNARPTISTRLRAQLLLAVVVGNLRLSTGRTNTMPMTATSPSDKDPESDGVVAPSTAPVDGLTDNTWSRVMSMLDEQPGPSNSQKVSLGTKLKAILNCQESFGTTIGGPILFFGGGFIYTCLDIHKNSLGDNDTAHALAFGMWYMTVPNLAIIASAMLAATNPDALQGLVWDGGEAALRRKKGGTGRAQSLLSRIRSLPVIRWAVKRLDGIELMEKAYDGHFETVSLWNRGSNKRRWIHEAIRDYASTYDYDSSTTATTTTTNDSSAKPKSMTSPEQVREALREDWGDILNALLASAIILITPTVLAFITSYNMPRKGMACRSLTYLIYGISQVIESLLWMWELWLKLRYGERWSQAHTRAKTINWFGQMLVGFWAIFAAIVGTLMQLLGVYRSCACKIPISYWIEPNAPDAYIDLSSNSHGDIEAANQYWLTTGVVSIGFLCMVSALAWWHQRRLRKMFRDEATILDRDLQLLT